MPAIERPISRSLSRALTLFPLWPLLTGVLAGVYLADLGGCYSDTWHTHWLYGAVGGGLLCLAVRKLSITLIVAGLLLGHGSHGLVVCKQQTWQNTANAQQQNKASSPVQLSGVVIDTGSHGDGPYLIKTTQTNDPSLLPPGINLVLSLPFDTPTPLTHGEIVQAEGELQPIEPLRNPHGFDRAQWRHRQGADLSLILYQPIKRSGIQSLRRPIRTLSYWRQHLRQQMTAGLAPDSEEAQLIRAVVLGERPPRPSGMIDDFRNSGTLHVFAVSGLHVGMVGSILALCFWVTRAPRWLIIVLTIIGMATYAGITGLRPPAVRAVIMATVFLTGFLIQRRPTLINSLAASAIIVLLWDGHQLFTPGFQLSYGVLFAIALLSRFWTKLLWPIGALDSFMPRLLLTSWQERRLSWREKLQAALSVSCAAWVGSTPLMWFHFGIVTPIAVLASLPLMFLIFIVLGLAMLSLATGTIWPAAGEGINHLNALVARTTHRAAASFAHVPGGHFNRRPQPPEAGRIIVFDLPHGGAANLIEIGGGLLLDSGSSRTFSYHVLPTLSYLQSNPDSLIISHADSSHSGAMTQCLDLYQPKQALIPRRDQRSPSFKNFLQQAAKSDCRVITPHFGQTFSLGDSSPDVFLEILHAPTELDGDGLADDTGLVIRLHWHGWKILFTGDAGWITESRLLNAGTDLQSDVIIMGRNRDDISAHLPFIDAVSPRAIISSHWGFPEQERIPNKWRKAIEKRGITLFDQKQSGAVTLTLDGNTLQLTPMLPTSKPLRLNTSN